MKTSTLLLLILGLFVAMAHGAKMDDFTVDDSENIICSAGENTYKRGDSAYLCVIVNLHTELPYNGTETDNCTGDGDGMGSAVGSGENPCFNSTTVGNDTIIGNGTAGNSTNNSTEPYFNPGLSVFRPKVDEFSMIELHPNVSWVLRAQNEGKGYATIQVAVGSRISPPRRFSIDENRAVGFYTAFVVLDKGKVDHVYWDEGCWSCTSKNCLDDNCMVTGCYDSTDPESDGSECGVKIYVVWSGKDSEGRYCLSEGYSFSNFQRYGAGGFWNNAADKALVSYDSASQNARQTYQDYSDQYQEYKDEADAMNGNDETATN